MDMESSKVDSSSTRHLILALASRIMAENGSEVVAATGADGAGGPPLLKEGERYDTKLTPGKIFVGGLASDVTEADLKASPTTTPGEGGARCRVGCRVGVLTRVVRVCRSTSARTGRSMTPW